MSFFKKVMSFFGNKKVQATVKTVATTLLGNSSTTGKALNLAMDLGAFDFLASFLGTSFQKATGVQSDASTKLLQFASKAVVETQKSIDAGALTTPEQKRVFANNVFKAYLASDTELSGNATLMAVAPMVIQGLYETNKMKMLLDKTKREEVLTLMITCGTKGLSDPSYDAVKEFFNGLDRLAQ